MKKEYFFNIELIRFVLTVGIVVLHVSGTNHAYQIPFIRDIAMFHVFVSCFFIMAGFFLFRKDLSNVDTVSFAKTRFFRLAPMVWITMLLSLLFSICSKNFSYRILEDIPNIFLIHSRFASTLQSPITTSILWFVSCLFWGSLFYFYLQKVCNKKTFNLITVLLIFAYVLVHPILKKSELIGLGSGLWCLGCMGIGIVMALLWNDGFKREQNFSGGGVLPVGVVMYGRNVYLHSTIYV